MISSVINMAFSGMAAQQARLDAAAQNIANADTPRYVRREVDMVSAPNGGVRAVTREGEGGVDLAMEMAGMIDTRMAYEANVSVMETGMDMWDALMSALSPEDRDERWR